MLCDEGAKKMQVFAGDVIPQKKPAPDIYNLAAEKLRVNPAKCDLLQAADISLLMS